MQTEEPRIRVCKNVITHELSKGRRRHSELFEAVRKHTGHGRVSFEIALNELVGSGQLRRIRKGQVKMFELTELGRQRLEDSKTINDGRRM